MTAQSAGLAEHVAGGVRDGASGADRRLSTVRRRRSSRVWPAAARTGVDALAIVTISLAIGAAAGLVGALVGGIRPHWLAGLWGSPGSQSRSVTSPSSGRRRARPRHAPDARARPTRSRRPAPPTSGGRSCGRSGSHSRSSRASSACFGPLRPEAPRATGLPLQAPWSSTTTAPARRSDDDVRKHSPRRQGARRDAEGT